MAGIVVSAGDSNAGETEQIVVEGAWTRATPPKARTAAGYMVLRNKGRLEDRLARIAAPVAEAVEIHSTTMDDGVMRMRPLELPVVVPAGGEVKLRPGGLHVMMMGIKTPFREGDRVKIHLTFERAGQVVVEMPVARAGAIELPQ